MSRRLLLAAALALGIAVAVPLAVLGFRDGDHGPSRRDYLSRVNAICKTYETRLQGIPPPSTFANPLIVRQSIGEALPLVERRLAEIRLVEPPRSLRQRVTEMLAAADAATAALESVLAAARAESVPRMGDALTAFLAARETARRQSEALGITC